MCYTEDSGAAHPMQQDCAGLPGAIPQNYDCGRDDYFSPAPAPGSYLATHWNTYDSAFLAPCGEIAPACGGGQLWVPEPPAATSGPTVGGTARRGSRLTANPGAWINQPSGYSYQWQRLDGTWEDIDSATGASYVATTDDLGRRLRVTVIATNEDGTASAASGATAPVGAAGLNRAASSSSKSRHKKRTVKAKTSSKKNKHHHKKKHRKKNKHKKKHR
jgi:hypothetical protein